MWIGSNRQQPHLWRQLERADREWSELALEHYGTRVEDKKLDWFIEARAFQVAVWTVVIGDQHPEVLASLEARLEWLRERNRQR